MQRVKNAIKSEPNEKVEKDFDDEDRVEEFEQDHDWDPESRMKREQEEEERLEKFEAKEKKKTKKTWVIRLLYTSSKLSFCAYLQYSICTV